MDRQPANALDGNEGAHPLDRRPSSAMICETGVSESVFYHPYRASVTGQVTFGEYRKRKVLCPCGAIAEVDSAVAGAKSSLGKTVECRSCRNRRIAHEREELDSHFKGAEDDGEDPW